jgi:carbamoyltransferase
MTITFDAKAEAKDDCKAIVHVDGTTRPQSVSKERDPEYHRVLSEYRKLTKRGLFVNTSFNMHEEPIVCSPYDAVRSLLVGACDLLAIEDFIAEPPAGWTPPFSPKK